MTNHLARARYLLSAHNVKQLPPDGGFEVAFAGRSNAGKSSALNAMCQQNALARVSKTPGRTQQLVFFDVSLPYRGPEPAPDPDRFLVDLPGYGYAKVPQNLQAHWQAFLDRYFATRQALRGLVVVMDIRHPLKDYDRQMIGYAVERGLPAHALLTKADKFGRGQQQQQLLMVRKDLRSTYGDTVSVQTFSGESKQGVEEAREVVMGWLELSAPSAPAPVAAPDADE
ncbi:ribosome biogenesis GTP-binding protein YihA/YsxC [Pseudomonas sp. CGJS7]|uniref:ribosome biogenesis GTP-binding protein YihA/YsxC n=1 Tax=Pseudomonas sp. CGJS7 TaxID=3109348 RepID=UPI00300A22EF